MKVAIVTEIKNNEFRVAITPAGVHDLVSNAALDMLGAPHRLIEGAEVASLAVRRRRH